jgi:glycosyltransferase involved in cell wall biosynthesis
MSNGSQPGSILIIAGFPRSLVNFRGPLLQAMGEQGWPVEAAAPALSRDPATSAHLARMGIAGHDIPLSRTGMNPIADLRLLCALVRLLRSRRPHAVLAYTMKAVIFGLVAAAIARVPRRFALITGLGYAFTGAATGRRRAGRTVAELLYRISLRHADKLFFQNWDDLSLFRQLALFPDTVPAVVVNGSGIDLDHFSPAPMPPGPIRFLLIARLLTAKGICEYAAAASMIRQKYGEVEFHLVGGLDTNPDAIPVGKVKSWQQAGILIWHGEIADVRPMIARTHVYVLPSYREGTPRSVLEAMAMGRPIITTDAPGCCETVMDGLNGFLVPVRSVQSLADAMERFIIEPGLVERFGVQSRILAERKYDVHLVNASMLSEMELT